MRDAGEEAVVERPLHLVGVARVAGGEEHPPVPLDGADRRARLGVGAVGRQLVRVAERLVGVARADPAGEVRLARRPCRPTAAPARRAARASPRLERDVGDAGREVEHAHRVPGRSRSPRAPARGPGSRLGRSGASGRVPRPRGVDEVAGQLEVAAASPVSPVQLDERGLDLGVAAVRRRAARARRRSTTWSAKRRATPSRRSSPRAAACATAGLDQVPEAVELVVPRAGSANALARPDDLVVAC